MSHWLSDASIKYSYGKVGIHEVDVTQRKKTTDVRARDGTGEFIEDGTPYIACQMTRRLACFKEEVATRSPTIFIGLVLLHLSLILISESSLRQLHVSGRQSIVQDITNAQTASKNHLPPPLSLLFSGTAPSWVLHLSADSKTGKPHNPPHPANGKPCKLKYFFVISAPVRRWVVVWPLFGPHILKAIVCLSIT